MGESAASWPFGSAEYVDQVKAGFNALLDLQEQHGNAKGALMFLTGLSAEEIDNLGGVPDAD